MQSNVLMCVTVATLIRHRIDVLARFRCAGTVGHSTYEELVATKRVPSCVEVSEETIVGDTAVRSPFCPVAGMPLPMHAPYNGTHCLKNVGMVLVMGAALARCHKPAETRQRKFQKVILDWWSSDLVPEAFHHFPFPKHIELRGFEGVSTLGMGFLEGFPSLLEVDLTPLSAVTMIGGDFMRGNALLQKINLAPFSNVTSIGDRFMLGCRGVQRLDLSPLSKVTSVGSQFLSETGGVIGRSFAQMVSLAAVGPSLFDHNSSVTSVDLAFFARPNPAASTSTISPVATTHLLSHCSQLQSINLAPLAHITAIYNNFLAHSGLRSINLAPLIAIDSIGHNFLEGCCGLSSIDLTPLGRVTSIGWGFMSFCGSLESVDITPLEKVPDIRTDFFGNCHKLKSVTGFIPDLMPTLYGLPKPPPPPAPAAEQKEVRRHKPVDKHTKKEPKTEAKKQKSKYNRHED